MSVLQICKNKDYKIESSLWATFCNKHFFKQINKFEGFKKYEILNQSSAVKVELESAIVKTQQNWVVNIWEMSTQTTISNKHT